MADGPKYVIPLQLKDGIWHEDNVAYINSNDLETLDDVIDMSEPEKAKVSFNGEVMEVVVYVSRAFPGAPPYGYVCAEDVDHG